MKDYFNDIEFANLELRWLFLLIPLLVVWYVLKQKKHHSSLAVSTLSGLKDVPKSIKSYLRHITFVIRLIVVALVIIVMMRPQSRSSFKDIKAEGIDIVMALDISSSMLAKDFSPDRLEAAKEVAIDFIDSRPNDRVGLVIFSGESFTQCPLTTDHAVLKNLFAGIKTGMVADGTAIGNGLATAVARIKDSKAKSKVIILLTDGVNNQGQVAPITAADIAQKFGVRVYTVGVGTRGKALSPVAMYPDGSFQYGYVDVNIDEKVLNHIASLTGGKYFRATDNDKLKEIYKEIDKLEKTIFEERNFTNKAECFFPFAATACVLLLLEFLLRNTLFRSLV